MMRFMVLILNCFLCTVKASPLLNFGINTAPAVTVNHEQNTNGNVPNFLALIPGFNKADQESDPSPRNNIGLLSGVLDANTWEEQAKQLI
ncbi:hypothetical protein BY458DRAFT_526206 [Sporodiniella umbellata]|nr:hypothetical protein BY458DRAFT_526206 [Sporodiniella umbellata]